MKTVTTFFLIACLIVLIPAAGLAEFKPGSGQIDGYMAAEYYYNIDHHSGSMDDGGIMGRHGFWFRRIYFTYNNTLSDAVKMRLRLEMNSTSNLFSASTLVPYVKDAYLSWKFAGSSSLIAGIQSPPSFNQVEEFWGYRPLEKTPLDLYRWTSSRDFGISLKGGNTTVYHVMYANGSSNKSEDNNGKKLFGSLGYKSGGIFVEGMAQYERAKSNGDDDIILQAFGGYTGDWGRVGLQYAYRDYKNNSDDTNYKYNIASLFVIFKPSEKVDLIGRWDYNFGDGYKSSFSGEKIDYIPFANNHEFNWVLVAVSWQAHKNVWLIPNIKFASYSKNDLLEA
ncbi:hypothetical protein ACFLT2_14350, partial [Acidobacteriota bacterium]